MTTTTTTDPNTVERIPLTISATAALVIPVDITTTMDTVLKRIEVAALLGDCHTRAVDFDTASFAEILTVLVPSDTLSAIAASYLNDPSLVVGIVEGDSFLDGLRSLAAELEGVGLNQHPDVAAVAASLHLAAVGFNQQHPCGTPTTAFPARVRRHCPVLAGLRALTGVTWLQDVDAARSLIETKNVVDEIRTLCEGVQHGAISPSTITSLAADLEALTATQSVVESDTAANGVWKLIDRYLGALGELRSRCEVEVGEGAPNSLPTVTLYGIAVPPKPPTTVYSTLGSKRSAGLKNTPVLKAFEDIGHVSMIGRDYLDTSVSLHELTIAGVKRKVRLPTVRLVLVQG